MKIESIDPAHVIGTAEPILVCLWRTVTTRAAIAKLRATGARLAASEREGFAMMTVVEASADLPDPDVRADLAEYFRAVSSSVVCSALVFEGQGFRAAAVRGITTGLNLMARQPFPHKVFATVQDAASWIDAQSGGRIASSSVIDEVAKARAALDEVTAESGRA
jgi:hypothetical protein